jgi:hypothetical protein
MLKINSNSKAYKDCLEELFLSKVLKCLNKATTNSKIISFPEIFYHLGTLLHLNKKECWYILRLLQQDGLIRVVPFKGIKIVKLLKLGR